MMFGLDRAHRRKRCDDAGVAAVEMVVWTPVLLIVLAFCVVLGRLGQAEGEVQSAVRAAARAASEQRSAADAQRAANLAAGSDLSGHEVLCHAYRLNIAVQGPGGIDRAELSCTVALGGIGWAGVAPSKTITAQFDSPVDYYRAGTGS